MPADSTTPEENPVKKPKKICWKRKLRRWLMFFSIFGIIVVVINGPIARWGIHRFGLRSLEKIGLQGEFEIHGSIAAGFIIKNAQLDGTKSIRKLYFSRAEIRYELDKLIDEQIVEVLQVNDLDLTIDIAYRGPEANKDKDLPSAWKILTETQSYIASNPFKFDDAKVSLVQGDDVFSIFNIDKFRHEAGSEDLRFLGFTGLRGGVTTEKQDVTITWRPEEMRLDRWELLPNFTATGVVMDWEGDCLHQIGGSVTLGASPFEVKYLPTGQLRANQQEGPPLDSETVGQLFGVALPLRVSLAKTNLELSEMNGNFPNWGLDLSADFKNFVFGDLRVADLSIAVQQYDAKFDAIANAKGAEKNLEAALSAVWLEPSAAEWWRHGQGQADIKIGQIERWLKGISKPLELPDYEISGGDLEFSADGAWAPIGLVDFSIDGDLSALQWRGAVIPDLAFQASEKSASNWKFSIQEEQGDLELDASVDLTAKSYSGRVNAERAPQAWLNPLLQLFVPELTLNNALSLAWSGSGHWGSAAPAHEGALELKPLKASYGELAPLQASASVNYAWPNFIKINWAEAAYGDYGLAGELAWQDKQLSISRLELNDPAGQLAEVQGELPLDFGVTSASDFFQQPGPVQLKINTPKLEFQRFIKAVKLQQQKSIDNILAMLQADLLLDGNLQNLILKGTIKVDKLRGMVEKGVAPLSGIVELDTQDGMLSLAGQLQETDAKSIAVTGSLPLKILQLIEEPSSYQELPVDFSAKVEQLTLDRVFTFIPNLDEEIKQLKGLLDFQFNLGGTLGELGWSAATDMKIDEFRMIERGIARIQDLEITASFGKGELNLENLSGRVGGGQIQASGEVLIAGLDGFDFQPELGEFELSVQADHAPVFRDDQVLVRANADLKLTGRMEDALISGQVGIVESLFFKDIELIPFGVPSSDVASFELPMIDMVDCDDLPVPEPFRSWKLDIATELKDPFLVRGNLARGRVTGSLNLGGTLANPEPVGVLEIEEVVARLPFSKLRVNKSQIVFSEGSGLDPKLDIRGTSRVSNYDVNVYAYGTVSNPDLVFSSNPPLPEAEIMTLLATGTTAAGLENADVASAKAFQLLLAELRERSNKPGGNKLFSSLVSVLDEVEVNFGENSAFTNRRFNSASIEFSDSWNFTAMFDQQGNTRGLVIFSIRMK